MAIGSLLSCVALFMLTLCERRHVRNIKFYGEAKKQAISVDSVEKVDESNNFKIVHASAMTATYEAVKDEKFNLSVANCM